MNIASGRLALIASALIALCPLIRAAEPPPTVDLAVTNSVKQLSLPLVSGVDQFTVQRTPSLTQPFADTSSGHVSGYNWTEAGAGAAEFFRLKMLPKPPEDVLTATVLNRLAYGPTPDELERVKRLGPDAYIQEQLAPESISENLDIDEVNLSDDWQRVVVTGVASSSTLYMYMSGSGDCYIDDIQLFRGGAVDSGTDLMKNGGFENGLTGWTLSTNLTDSVVVTDTKHGGSSALHMISTARGTSRASSIFRTDLGLRGSDTYTLAYWFKPGANRRSILTVRLSGSGILSSPGTLGTRLTYDAATLEDLDAWHILHAIRSKKQLQEVLLQFCENHFVTQQSKSRDYLDRYYDGDETDRMATSLEYHELTRWKQALQNPKCTFRDLLQISAESPAMIIYLDTINSRGDGSNIANENYARELLELFTFGVDNGYDQNDITEMSRVWTGWSMRVVDPENVNDPFAVQTTKVRPGTTNEPPKIGDLDGVWTFGYKPENHNYSEKVLFPGKTVPDRFGPPYAGRNYELKVKPELGGDGDWQHVVVQGTSSSSVLYLYVEAVGDYPGTGDCYIDDIQVVPGTIPEAGANAVANGGFESGTSGWTFSANLKNSQVVTDVKHSGNASLHVVSTAPGSTRASSIYRTDLGLPARQPYTLSFWFKPGADLNGLLTMRLSGSGIVATAGGNQSIEEGYTVVQHLADQPFTQEFISVKLCRLFVHDDFAIGYNFTDPNLSPEGHLVRDCMRAWEENEPKGQIRKVLDVIFHSERFRSQGASMQKVKTPLEFVVSALRALRADTADGLTADSDGRLKDQLNRMGRMRLFDRDNPDGYPEAAAPWISAGTLTERLRFVQALMINPGQGGRADAGAGNWTDPVKLLKARLPQSAWHDADAVADYFLALLFPGEGKANLDEYHAQAVAFLNTTDNGATSSAFSSLADTSTGYDTRVRGMIALLMTSQRFQEQ